MSIVVSLIAGWVLLIGITFAIQKGTTQARLRRGAAALRRSSLDSIGRTGAKLLLLVVIGAQLFCGMSSVTANSRMIYAFSRDGALPGSQIWHQVNKRTRTPDQRHLAGGWRRARPGPALPVERRRVRRRDLDRGHRPVHRLRDARRSCGCARARASSAGHGTSAAGATSIGMDRPSSGSSSSRSCSCCPQFGPIRLERTFNYALDRGGRRHRVRRHLLAGVGQQVVHRPAGPGHA